MTYDDRAIQMARDLAENALARKICVEIIKGVHSIPKDQQIRVGESMLHGRLLQEMCDYKQRLAKQVETVLTESMREMKAKVSA